MIESNIRPLHLYDLSSLLTDLVAGKTISLSDETTFSLESAAARRALNWYRNLGEQAWTSNVSDSVASSLIAAISAEETELSSDVENPPSAGSKPYLQIKKLVAHNFAGLHLAAVDESGAADFEFEFSSEITLFEGRNGSGKTSLLNAIVWTLTGDVLRAQSSPSSGVLEYECEVQGEAETLAKKIASVSPLPNSHSGGDWVAADTWVELTFVNQDGQEFGPFRRSISRTPRGKLEEISPDFSLLDIEPISFRIGTSMPGMLKHIQLGAASELGKAISELTGLQSLTDLSRHAERLEKRLSKSMTKAKEEELGNWRQQYDTTLADLRNCIGEPSNIQTESDLPLIEQSLEDESLLKRLSETFEAKKSELFKGAKSVLGDEFDPSDSDQLVAVEQSVGSAISELSQIASLPSFEHLRVMKGIENSLWDRIIVFLKQAQNEFKELERYSEKADLNARKKLYSRIITWKQEFSPKCEDTECVVCGSSILEKMDPVSGRRVIDEIESARDGAELHSLTLAQWEQRTLASLEEMLPKEISGLISVKLPDHPADLMKQGLTEELFSRAPFKSVLGSLKIATNDKFDEIRSQFDCALPECEMPRIGDLTRINGRIAELEKIWRFCRWRFEQDGFVKEVFRSTVGSDPQKDADSLRGRLASLDALVKEADPMNKALELTNRLDAQSKKYAEIQKTISEFTKASQTLSALFPLGKLADTQVSQLQHNLANSAAAWQKKIYRGAFPTRSPLLTGAELGRKGELQLQVKQGITSAPAHFVSNASALRSHLVGFYLAFWEHVFQQNGGFAFMLLDDPQELLDAENSDIFADAISTLPDIGARVVVTSYDSRFCSSLSKYKSVESLAHFEVSPAKSSCPTVRVQPPTVEIIKRLEAYERDLDNERAAQDFVDMCRRYIEQKLGDVFDEPAYSRWTKENPNPSLESYIDKLRSEIQKSGVGLLSSKVFEEFCVHPGTATGSEVRTLMNKAYHGRFSEIRAGDVAPHLETLRKLIKLAEDMFLQSYRWRQAGAVSTLDEEQDTTDLNFPELDVIAFPTRAIPIFTDVAAFEGAGLPGDSQRSEENLEGLGDMELYAFVLRRNNFGFAAPAGAIVLVGTHSTDIDDRRMVIAYHPERILARRLLRAKKSDQLALEAELSDPRQRNPATIFCTSESIRLHQIHGLIFEHEFRSGNGNDEAEAICADGLLDGVEVGFRISGDSAVPLALDGQLVLGGKAIPLSELDEYTGKHAVILLNDGSAIYKRIGKPIGSVQSRLRQFESVGGLGDSVVASLDPDDKNLPHVQSVRLIIGVLYKQ